MFRSAHPVVSILSCLGWLLLFFGLLIPSAHGHSTIIIDQNTTSFLTNINKINGTNGGPLIVHSLVTVRLRSEDTQVDLTVADTAAYQLLDHDAYLPADGVRTTINPSPSSDPHFNLDQAELGQLAPNLFSFTNNQQVMQPRSVVLELTSTQDVIFHFTYPPMAFGQLQIQAKYADKIPPDQRILVEVLGRERNVLAYAGLGKDNPSMIVSLDLPTPPPPPTISKISQIVSLLGGLLAATGAFLLLSKLRHQPAPPQD